MDIHGDGYRPGEHVAAEPVHDRHQVDKAAVHPDVGDIGRPYLVWPVDCESSEQIRIDLVFFIALTQLGLGIDRLDAHLAHQALNPLVIDAVALFPQGDSHPPDPVEGSAGVLLIYEPHQLQFISGHPEGLIVPAGPVEPQKLTLSDNGKIRVMRLNELSFLLKS